MNEPTPLALRDFGYAPGDYSCICFSCSEEFIGDKRSSSCEGCATMKLRRSAAQPAADTIAKPQGSLSSNLVAELTEIANCLADDRGNRCPPAVTTVMRVRDLAKQLAGEPVSSAFVSQDRFENDDGSLPPETAAPLDLEWLESMAKYAGRKDDKAAAEKLLAALQPPQVKTT